MKTLLLLIIKSYWTLVPKAKRRKCLFRISCSHHVYKITKDEGLYKGLLAFHYRFKNCRDGYHLFNCPNDGGLMLMLPNNQILREAEIAERFIK